MSAIIYWFSGTGNTYYVAESISEGTNGRLVPVSGAVRDNEITPEAERIGIVFPVYFGGLPNIIEHFAGKLRGLSTKYVFAVATYGGGRGDSFERLDQLLAANGGRLAAMFGVHMPQNAFRKFWEKPGPLYKNALKMAGRICRHVQQQDTGLFTTSSIMDTLQKLVYPMTEKANTRFLMETAHGAENEPRSSLLSRLDNTFSVTDECTGCGTCVKVCPVGNIALKDEKPQWLHHCVNCISCYNYCPNKAIRSTMIKEGYYYRQPDFSPIKARSA